MHCHDREDTNLAIKARYCKPATMTLLTVILIAVLGTAFVQSLLILPRQLTRTALISVGKRILIYMSKHNKVPPTLMHLPVIQGTGNETTDAWRHEIVYEVDATRKVTLKSLGKDGLPGGVGNDSDITCSFPLLNEHCNWSHARVLTVCMKGS